MLMQCDRHVVAVHLSSTNYTISSIIIHSSFIHTELQAETGRQTGRQTDRRRKTMIDDGMVVITIIPTHIADPRVAIRKGGW
jgi:hypothetical protein